MLLSIGHPWQLKIEKLSVWDKIAFEPSLSNLVRRFTKIKKLKDRQLPASTPHGQLVVLSPRKIWVSQYYSTSEPKQEAASCSLAAVLGLSAPHMLAPNSESTLSLHQLTPWGEHLARGSKKAFCLFQLTTLPGGKKSLSCHLIIIFKGLCRGGVDILLTWLLS